MINKNNRNKNHVDRMISARSLCSKQRKKDVRKSMREKRNGWNSSRRKWKRKGKNFKDRKLKGRSKRNLDKSWKRSSR